MAQPVEDLSRVEEAGRDLARTALFALGEARASSRVVVLVGEGPTGAAGVSAARHLSREGVAVKLCCASHDAFPAERAAYRRAGGFEVLPERVAQESPDLILDAQGGRRRAARWPRMRSVSVVGLEVPPGPEHVRAADLLPTDPPLWIMRLALAGNGISLAAAGDLFL